MNNAQLINQDSKDFEYYTDPKYTAGARQLMSWIELDPASSAGANQKVGARRIFTAADDGLAQSWASDTLWLNHPFSKGEEPCPPDRSRCKKKCCVDRGYHIDKRIPSNADWINKLMNSFEGKEIEREALCITYAATSEAWYRPLQQFAQLHIVPRCNYFLPDGTIKKGVTKGSSITFLTRDWRRIRQFDRFLGHWGEIKLPYRFYLASSLSR